MIIRHMLATALTEACREETLQHIVDGMFIPLGRRLLPFLVTISVVAVFMLLATVATLVMALSCFLKLRSR
jgi:hypothetical protein